MLCYSTEEISFAFNMYIYKCKKQGYGIAIFIILFIYSVYFTLTQLVVSGFTDIHLKIILQFHKINELLNIVLYLLASVCRFIGALRKC